MSLFLVDTWLITRGFVCFGFWFVILDSDAMKMSPDKCLLRFYPQGNFI